jgi:hypothetical protein
MKTPGQRESPQNCSGSDGPFSYSHNGDLSPQYTESFREEFLDEVERLVCE